MYASNVFEIYYCNHLKAMLFSLIGFETQTCIIICETHCKHYFRCNSVYMMCICLIVRSWLWCGFPEVLHDTRWTSCVSLPIGCPLNRSNSIISKIWKLKWTLVPLTWIGRTYKIPKLGRMCPQRPFNNFIVGVNGMCFNKSWAKDVDMILIPTTGL